MYLIVDVFVERGTQEGLTHRNKNLTVGFLVGILKCIILFYLTLQKFTYYIVNKGREGLHRLRSMLF